MRRDARTEPNFPIASLDSSRTGTCVMCGTRSCHQLPVTARTPWSVGARLRTQCLAKQYSCLVTLLMPYGRIVSDAIRE